MGKGTRYKIEYEDKLVHNTLAVAQNAILSVALKFKVNILLVMTTLVFMSQPATLSSPTANPPHALLKEPNALIFK